MNNQITIRAGQIEFETLLELINIQVEHNRTDTQTKEESDETNNLEDIAQQIQFQLISFKLDRKTRDNLEQLRDQSRNVLSNLDAYELDQDKTLESIYKEIDNLCVSLNRIL